MARSSKRGGLLPHRKTLLLAGFATLAGLFVPYIRTALLPVMYLNTHLHELSHALMALVTGGHVERILVHADGSGETPVLGGSLLLTASAGYIGASIFGAAMIAMGSVVKTAKIMLGALCVLLILSTAVWVRGDTVGVLSGFCWIAVLAGLSFFLNGRAVMFACQFLGLQQCLNSFNSLAALLRISVATEVHSDASILQELTGISSTFWAGAWCVLSLVLVIWTVRRTWEPVKITSVAMGL